MSVFKRTLLALSLLLSCPHAFAQSAPPPVPALPDTERRTSYSIAGTTCACAVNFALYGDTNDYQNWVEVYINGVFASYSDLNVGWTITSPTGSLGSIPRPITDAVLTFNSVQTGTIQIVGARRPRRISQFSENRGVAARDLNQAVTDITAVLREMWDKDNDVTGRSIIGIPGEQFGPLPSATNRAGKYLCFDTNGNPSVCAGSAGGTGSFGAGSGISFTGSNPTIISVLTGTSGATVPLLNGNNTWSGTNAFSQPVTLTNPTINTPTITTPTINGNPSGTALSFAGAGRFLPVIEASGPGSTSPFIRVEFCVWNGNKVMIAGTLQTIPSGACTSPTAGVRAAFSSACLNKVCGSALSANTDYYVGVYMLAGTMTMNFWLVSGGAGYVQDTTYGNLVKGDDAATSLIGVIHLNNTVSLDGSQKAQDSASLFNPVRISLLSAVSTANFTNVTFAELDSTKRLHWVQFSWDVPNVSAACTVTNTGVGNTTSVGIGMDSTTVPGGSPGTAQAPAGYQANATAVAQAPGADGGHFAALLAFVNAGTGSIPSCALMSTPLPS